MDLNDTSIQVDGPLMYFTFSNILQTFDPIIATVQTISINLLSMLVKIWQIISVTRERRQATGTAIQLTTSQLKLTSLDQKLFIIRNMRCLSLGCTPFTYYH
jgi:hypothetical protein